MFHWHSFSAIHHSIYDNDFNGTDGRVDIVGTTVCQSQITAAKTPTIICQRRFSNEKVGNRKN